MILRNRVIIVLLLLWQVCFFIQKANAQAIVKETNDSADIATGKLKQSIIALDNALLHGDSVALEKLLNDEVEIKHSNGWVQTKADVFKDFRDSTLRYDKVLGMGIGNGNISYETNIAKVTRAISVIGRFKEYNFDMYIRVKEEWIYENGQWQLWSRKSEKIE